MGKKLSATRPRPNGKVAHLAPRGVSPKAQLLLLLQGRRVLELHKQWRDRVHRWPTSAELRELSNIHRQAERFIKEIEKRAATSGGSKPLADLHWELQMIAAVPVGRLQKAVRQGEALEDCLMGKD